MFKLILAFTLSLGVPAVALAQGAGVAFGGLRQDTTLPVEIEADELQVNQADGTAIFVGNVKVAQGTMRLSAGTVQVDYADGGGIERLHATGGVTLASNSDAAEAQEAVYTIDSGEVVMTGDVLLTQGNNALSGQRLVIDLQAGTGRMQGRVQTVFRPGSAP